MTVRRSLPYLYLVVNAASALAVLYAAHEISALMRAEQRTASDSVDGITFFAKSAPAFLVTIGVNVAWARKGLLDLSRRRDGEAFAWLDAARAIWAAAVVAARFV